MSADPSGEFIQRLSLPPFRSTPWQQWLPAQLSCLEQASIEVDAGDWHLSCRDLQELLDVLEAAGHSVHRITSHCQDTLISAAALGVITQRRDSNRNNTDDASAGCDAGNGALTVHQGTLRSGDHIESRGHLLIVGDVNPGGSASADGDVYIWGRLRGRAHAGLSGNRAARIVALQLRPLQLRIADLVARGPEEQPQPGLAEQACILEGAIAIEPARPPFAPQ